jgi:hypothetical protein
VAVVGQNACAGILGTLLSSRRQGGLDAPR